MSYQRRCIGLILACMVGVAHADPWDDFANNLFTDLAPLLALFGERATMQFMSQALGWEDCLLLAMAPLGIITILVSAIRVGGPAWLKAVVGRARENISAAEMELMSSTSKEVCELYNGQTIVRCQGSTPVWEFIYLIPTTLRNQNSHKKLDIRVLTLEEACSGSTKLLRKLENNPPQNEDPTSHASTGRMARIFRKVFAKSAPSSTRDASVERGFAPHEAIYVIRNMSSDAPNIILNLQSNNSNRKELQAFASVGVILQMCVVAFFGIITYHPSIKNTFRKDNKRVDDYAFPLAVSGTLVLALGVFLCGTVVESSTRETHYKRNDKYEMRIVWIQQKQTVGDQVFEPFATFPNTPRNVVTMSRRCDKVEARSLEPLTIIGICAGLAGFIIQFIGLRGMNSAATLAQLGVVGIMTVIRAWVRRGLAMPPWQQKLTSDFELDSLAWALTLLANSQNGGPGETASLVPQLGDLGPSMKMERQKPYSWTISTGSDVRHEPFLYHRPSCSSKAQQVLETRRNLSRLAQFKGPAASEAVNLVTAMEKVLNVLFPLQLADDQREWTWPLPIVYNDRGLASCSQCYVHLPLIGKDGDWKVLADQLESVLSLCLFTAHEQEENESKGSQPEFDLNDQNDDWLRQKTMRSGLGIRLLGSTDRQKTDQLIQDLRWWAPETFDVLSEIQDLDGLYEDGSTGRPVGDGENRPIFSLESETRKELDQIFKRNTKLDAILIDDKRVVGYGPPRPQSLGGSGRQRHFRNFSILRDSDKRKKKRGVLAIESRDSLEKLYAKDLLFSFLISAAKTLPKTLQSKVETRDSNASTIINGASKVLLTQELTSLAAEFDRLGYGTEQEVWASTIAAFSVAEKLPSPRPLFDIGRERAEKFRQEGKWSDANREYLNLWKQTQCYVSSFQDIYARGTVLLIEHFHNLTDHVKLMGVERERDATSLLETWKKLHLVLQGSRYPPRFLEHLLRIYTKQKRPDMIELLQSQVYTTPAYHTAADPALAYLTPVYHYHPAADPTPAYYTAADPTPAYYTAADPTAVDSFPDYFGITGAHLHAFVSIKSINERDICQWTPLHYAAVRNDRLVMNLLRHGADVNALDIHGFTPLHYACQHGNVSLVSRLMASGGKLDNRGLGGATPVHIAAKHGRLGLFVLWGPLIGTEKESLCMLKDLNGRIPIHWAVIHGQEDLVQELRSSIDEPDTKGWTSLHLAAVYHKRGSDLVNLVFRLSKEREKQDRMGQTPLLLAIDHSQTEAAHQLIEAGADVHVMPSPGETTVQRVIIRGGDAGLVQALVNKGVRVDIPWKMSRGSSPLHVAAREGMDDIIKIVLVALDGLGPETRSSALELRDDFKLTALHHATVHKHLEVVKLLLAAGADPNKTDGINSTVLHKVFVFCEGKQAICLELAKILVEHNANPQAENGYGETPFDMAMGEGHTEAAEYLKGFSVHEVA